MFDRERFVDLSDYGFDKPARVKRLTAGEKKDLDNAMSKANGVRMKGPEVVSDLAPGDTTLIAAFYYYVDGPFPRTKAAFEALDWEVVAKLEEEGEDLNLPLEVLKERKRLQELASNSSTVDEAKIQ